MISNYSFIKRLRDTKDFLREIFSKNIFFLKINCILERTLVTTREEMIKNWNALGPASQREW